MKRAFSVLLILAMFLPLVSCSSNNPEGTEQSEDSPQVTADTPAADTAAEEEEDPNTLEKLLPEADFGGRSFRISCNSKYSYEMGVDELNGEACNDAVYERNSKIDELYNVSITPVITEFVENQTQINEIMKNIQAGDDVYDLVGVYTYLAGRGILGGCYHSWNDVPTVDFSREWWVQSANEAFTIGSERYAAVGDLSITTLLLSYAVYFNRNLAGNYNLPNLYEIVKNGEWTMDKLLELSCDLYSDLNANGKADQNDMFGVAVESVTNLDVYPSAFNINLVSKDENNLPVIDIDAERMTTAAEKVYQLYYENNGATYSFPNEEEVAAFNEGRAMFLTTWLNQSFTRLREMQDDYGIIPYPKLDAAQSEYYTNSMDNYSVLSVPITVKPEDLGFVGHITEALTIESHNRVFPAYYDGALTSKYARDRESVEMLEIIMAGRKYDFSILHGGDLSRLPYMFRDLIAGGSADFASTFARTQKVMNKGLEKLIKNYSELIAREQ